VVVGGEVGGQVGLHQGRHERVGQQVALGHAGLCLLS
jgi:hypothetical protein